MSTQFLVSKDLFICWKNGVASMRNLSGFARTVSMTSVGEISAPVENCLVGKIQFHGSGSPFCEIEHNSSESLSPK